MTPHPQYAAFYKWLQQEYKADAVVHFGMHGTVEWLPGAPLGKLHHSSLSYARPLGQLKAYAEVTAQGQPVAYAACIKIM